MSPNYGGRAALYGVSGIPHVEYGGTISSVGGGGNMYPTYLNIYNSLFLQLFLNKHVIAHTNITSSFCNLYFLLRVWNIY